MVIETLLLSIMLMLTLLYASWLVLAVLPKKKHAKTEYYDISVIVPAYNEEKNIEHTIKSITNADYPAKKEIIVVDDGSTDSTRKIVKDLMKKNKDIRLIKGFHKGKAKAVNLAVKHAKGDVLVILDADTEIDKDALNKIIEPFADKDVAAVASTLRVKKMRGLLNWFQQFEYAISTGWRYVVDKVNGSCIVPGFCAFRKAMLVDIGGFKGDTAVEDYDICMYLKKKGYKISMAPDSVARTKVPETLRGWIFQRVRWNRGTIQVIRKHSDVLLNKAFSGVGLYSMPTQLYWFFHAFAYFPLVVYQILGGYAQYFLSYGNIFSFGVVAYFVKWLTVYGMFEFIYNVALGVYASTFLNLITILVFVLSYAFALFSLIKFSDKISLQTLFALLFFFPYTLVVLCVYLVSTVYEMLSSDRGEKWEKGR